ncbi:hypothetical protein [Deinococcus fonticola]|uniref:hypothetical protein n=1 Tax=Deinococcus fonticola TaxID=2528713 RepID=UPI00107524EF|nr:hypothetical protein [Deinococcus fonticola]
MIELKDNAPIQLSMTVRRGDTMLWFLDFGGDGGSPLTPEKLSEYQNSTWTWQVRGNKPDGALLGEITVKGAPHGTGYRLSCHLPPATSAALMADPRVNYSDLQRSYVLDGLDMVDTVADMPIIASADATKTITIGAAK